MICVHRSGGIGSDWKEGEVGRGQTQDLKEPGALPVGERKEALTPLSRDPASPSQALLFVLTAKLRGLGSSDPGPAFSSPKSSN